MMNSPQNDRYGRVSCTQRRIIAAGRDRMAAHGLAALVVDDNPIVLELAAAMLEEIGYIVRTAGDGAQALSDFSRAPCDLMLTDYEMPDINGYQLGCKIKSRHPGTRVVIMTGLSRTEVSGMESDGCIDGWLFKPFSLAELQTLLERLGLPAKCQHRALTRTIDAEVYFTMNQRTPGGKP